MFVALFWMSATPDIFGSLCLSTVARTIGTSIVWIASTLLIQKFTPEKLLGRVSSFDSGVAMFAEALSALVGGMLMDKEGISAEELSFVLGVLGLVFFLCPSLFRPTAPPPRHAAGACAPARSRTRDTAPLKRRLVD